MTATSAGINAFRGSWMISDSEGLGDFDEYAARRARYAINWAHFEGTQYERLQSFAQAYKQDKGLYRAIRSIYNPTYRIASFYWTYLLGGSVVIDADGAATDQGALPIETDNDALRLALGALFVDSNMQANKDVIALRGAVLGDTLLRAIDDPTRGRVTISRVHPGSIYDIEKDDAGNIRGYDLREWRTDPAGADLFRVTRKVQYRETCERDGDLVVYRTYKDGQPFAWNDDQGAEWSEPYGFVPMVHIQHRDIGGDWGWAEFHPTLSKIREVDDLASKVDDQIRKAVDPAWLLSGVDNPNSAVSVSRQTATSNKPDPIREETPMLYGPVGATATPLMTTLNLEGSLSHIKNILGSIEGDHPEIKLMILRAQGTTSGAALRTAQEPVEVNVRQRRAAYDEGLTRIAQMCISIGGWRGYDGYQGFNLDSYAAGNMAMRIADRPVFGGGEADAIERDTALATAAKAMQAIGYAPDLYLEDHGWDEDKLAKMRASTLYKNITFADYP